jgi:hypothetical protein
MGDHDSYSDTFKVDETPISLNFESGTLNFPCPLASTLTPLSCPFSVK